MSGPAVAFVFQGGGSLAATQIGTLRALVERGVRPDFVIGSSSGALNAAMFAADPTPDGVDRLEAAWRIMRRRTVAPLSLLTLARAATGHGTSLVSDGGMRRLLLECLPIGRFDEAAVPVLVVATDQATGDPVVLSQGPAVELLLASTAFPGLYPPVRIAGRTLIDGGVAADTPVLQAEQHGAAICYVLPCATPQPTRGQRPSAVPMAYRALSQLLQVSARHDIADAGTDVRVLPVPTTTASHPLDFHDTARLITVSHRLALAELDERRLQDASVSTHYLPDTRPALRRSLHVAGHGRA